MRIPKALLWILMILGTMSATLAGAAMVDEWASRVPAKEHARANPFGARGESVSAGSLLYKDHCMQCHKAGAQGDGRKKPPLRSERIKTVTDGDLEWFLRQGDLKHGMPSWSRLPETQRWQIVAYLRSIQ